MATSLHPLKLYKGRKSVPEASLIIVGEILPTRFWVDKVGSWKSSFGSLRNAKFTISLGEPRDEEFAKDWANAVGRINGAIVHIGGARDEKTRNCIHMENDSTQIRLSTPIFEPLEPGAIVMDEVIQRWQVDAEHQQALNALKRTHKICPLRVFDIDDRPIGVMNMPALMKGALAEVHFSIRHWAIYRPDQPAQHSFSCTLNQICLLKRPPPAVQNPYKTTRTLYHPLLVQETSTADANSSRSHT
ncbi:uncharacterized protein EV420DRAFT_1640150 [Desarmillaria tabescens]|uniref:Uncharacterized protein n=1 Tax=Armillaria tabescens TaxID=1929756 RepID=A0AA39T3H9_ARMTA|nr:uncharacterized protein EV420DRAFT_1640150 [Desarmillaria tabescens]KAK0461846.1 hypothetical protein EV420DRAFT_1640150 [Desarmillaria tabescens]